VEELDTINISGHDTSNMEELGTINISDHDTPNMEKMELSGLIESGFDRMDSGDIEQAAEFFSEALGRRPSKKLEFNIVLKLCHIYMEFGQAELAIDILESYRTKYGDRIDPDVLTEMEILINELEP
jgi:outer membrane protein assembly factor BamD (BamD/ComL family)